MVIDWNWFYSAVSQCSAAIVGLFGAFLVTKMINREQEHALLLKELDSLIIKVQQQLGNISVLYFEWYNERKREDVRRSDEFGALVRRNEDQDSDIDKLIARLNYSCQLAGHR